MLWIVNAFVLTVEQAGKNVEWQYVCAQRFHNHYYKITKWIPSIINSRENSWIGQRRDKNMHRGMNAWGTPSTEALRTKQSNRLKPESSEWNSPFALVNYCLDGVFGLYFNYRAKKFFFFCGFAIFTFFFFYPIFMRT